MRERLRKRITGSSKAIPSTDNIDQYLRTRNPIGWEARQHADEISVGDKIIIWRSGAYAGAVADCLVEAPPSTSIPEDAPELYVSPHVSDDNIPRCRLKVLHQFVDEPIPRLSVKIHLPNLRIISSALRHQLSPHGGRVYYYS